MSSRTSEWHGDQDALPELVEAIQERVSALFDSAILQRAAATSEGVAAVIAYLWDRDYDASRCLDNALRFVLKFDHDKMPEQSTDRAFFCGGIPDGA